MRFRTVFRIVFWKEMRELLRDRRSLFWLFAPPIILPGLAVCGGIFIGTQAIRIARDGFPIIVENGEQAPELVRRFEDEEGVRLVEPSPDGSFGTAILIVVVPEDFQQQLEETGSSTIRMISRDSSLITQFGKSAVRGIISDFGQQLLDQRLESEGLTRQWLTPIHISEGRRLPTASVAAVVNSGDDEEDGSNLLATIFLPLAVTSWLLGGGMGLILDTMVGEKERQTIENLLVTPASRIGIVLGKMAVVFIASMLVMSLWLGEGMLLNGIGNTGGEILGSGSLSTTEAISTVVKNSGSILGLMGALLVLVIPFMVMLNGLMMAWCAYASTYREANLVMALIQLGLPASVLLTIFSLPADVADVVYSVPFFGTIVAIRDLFSSTLSTSGMVVNFISGLMYALGGIGLAAWMFEREWSLTRGLQ